MSDDNTCCTLCTSCGGTPLWRDATCRVVLIDDDNYPGFCRVILNRHVKEMSDLDSPTQQALMRVVFTLEQVLRNALQPDKINLASLGNHTPHLHWHIIPRWNDDPTFPDPIWAPPRRAGSKRHATPAATSLRNALTDRLGPSLPDSPQETL